MNRRAPCVLAAILGSGVCACALAAAPALPDTMSAAAIDRGGDAWTLSMHPLPVPRPGEGEVLIAVTAAGVGVWQARYRPEDSQKTHFPVVLGSDGAGVVAATGPGVQGFKAGDRVYGVRGAFYAGYVKLPAADVAHVPAGMSVTQAAALGISGLSALEGIDDILGMKRGETLIIHGAAGAVGTLAIQIARLRGVHVLATVSDEAGAALASRLGADAVVNGRTGDIVAAAKRLAPRGVDAVLGLAGGEGLEHCIDALRPQGRVAYLYGMEPLPRPRFGIRMTLYSFSSGTTELERLNQAVQAAHLQVPIAAEYPLAEAAAAHKRLAAGHLLGKIVIRVRADPAD